MKQMRHILYLLPVAMLLAACTQDELTDNGQGTPLPEPVPLTLTAAIGDAVAIPTTRGTVDNSWDGDEVIHVQIASNKDAGFTSESAIGWASIEPILYTVGTDGSLTLKDPTKQVYWQATDETLYIRAWCAGTGEDYTDIPMLDKVWRTPTDQSTSEALQQADFLFAYRSMTFEEHTVNAGLEFSHLTSKITINLANSGYLENKEVGVSLVSVYTGAEVWSIEGVFEGSGSNLALEEQSIGGLVTSITPCKLSSANENYYASYEAIVIPQGVNNMYKGIQVKLGNAIYQWQMSISNNLGMQSGSEYTFNITVKEEGLSVTTEQSIDWNTGSTGSGSVTLPTTYDITANDGARTLNLNDGDVVNITGDATISTTGNYYTFNISEGNTATVNLNGVELNWSGTQNYDCYAFSIDGGGTIIFNLCGKENTIQGFYNGIRGIWDGTAGNIHIIGPGTLNIKGTNVYGGIVTDKTKEIRIENAAVNMDYQYSSGDYPGAAIGSGSGEECGDITISNSAISIDIATTLQDGTLTADNWFGAAIGAGRNGACGNINITLQEGQTQAQFLEGISVQHTTLNVALDDEQKVGKGVYSQSCGVVTWLDSDGTEITE